MAKFKPKRTLSQKKPLWNGPTVDGITYSLLCKFLTCPERFRLRVVEGLREQRDFDSSIEYGSLWHNCEENFASKKNWRKGLREDYAKLVSEHPGQDKEITKWYNICLMQFEKYIAYWEKQQEHFNYKIKEQEYCVPYRVGNYTVLLRGKIDAIFTEGKDIYIQENKTKGRFDEEALCKSIDTNLQTMIYHIALRELLSGRANKIKINESYHSFINLSSQRKYRVEGTLYNVVRRPLADKFTIRQKQKESADSFYRRLGKIIDANETYFFKRFYAKVTPDHLSKFEERTLKPILHTLCVWWDSIKSNPFNPWQNNLVHYLRPFGVYDSLGLGYRGDYFEYITGGHISNLEHISDLFPELSPLAL